MSASAQRPPTTRDYREIERAEAERGRGWVAFAGFILTLIGIMNLVYGAAAIDHANFYINDAKYVVGDLNAWGWFMVCVGAVQIVAAFSIFRRTGWGRWVGLFSAGVNSILMLLFLPAYPFLALTLFAVDILVIYGLVAYGGRRDAS